MSAGLSARTYIWRFLGVGVIMMGGSLAAAPPTYAIQAVEEDWKLVLDSTRPETACPQFSTCFPLTNGRMFVVTWNYASSPDYQEGGFQLQAWQDGSVVDDVDVPEATLNYDSDTIRWTQVVKTNGQDCELKIVGCNSQTWGTNINTTAVTLVGSNIPNLDGYNVQSSMDDSGVSYGSNRVVWFGVTEVRLINDRGKVASRDTTPRAVFSR